MSSSTPPRASSIVLKISPGGYRSGLVSLTHQRRTLRILVLPKLWRDESVALSERLSLSQDTLTLIAHENERVALWFTDDSEAKFWKELIEECIDQLNMSHEAQMGEVNQVDSIELFDDPEVRKSLKSLMTIEQGRRPHRKSAEWIKVSSSDRGSCLNFTDRLDELLRLVLCARTFKAHDQDYSHTDYGSGYMVSGGQYDTDPLKLLISYAFIKEVQKHYQEVRQNYRLETAHLSVIRGQMTSRGLARYACLREPSIECSYDEFTSKVPLFQVIVSALDHLINGGLFPRIYRELSIVRELRQIAQILRQDLVHIPSLPLSTAAFVASRLRLKRVQSSWQSALQMARLILEKLPLDFTDQTEGQGAMIWNVDTSKVWENVLQQMLESMNTASPFKITTQETTKSPWLGLKQKKVDMIGRTQSSTYILDAKYKERGYSHTSGPSAAEQYQIFAYSFLALKRIGPIRCGLLYTTREELVHLRTWKRGIEYEANADQPGSVSTSVDLISIAVPFPPRHELMGRGVWQSWIKTQSTKLSNILLLDTDLIAQ